MAFVTVRASPGLRAPGAATARSRPARVAQPITARCRPLFCRPSRAFYPAGGSWDGASADAMKSMLNEMSKQWRASPAAYGPFYWPGARTGSGYVYGSGRCKQGDYNNAANPFTSQQQQAQSARSQPQLPLDVAESPEGFYTIYADVPGLSKPDLSIKLSKDRILTVAGERKAPFATDSTSSQDASSGVKYQQMERGFGAFERQWELPADAESEGITAKVAEGVLTITVPRKQQQPEVDEAQDIFIA